MGAVWAQVLPNHETGLRIEMCWREAFDPYRNIEVTGDLLVDEMELVGLFPDVSSSCQEVPAVLNLLGRTGQLGRADVEIREA